VYIAIGQCYRVECQILRVDDPHAHTYEVRPTSSQFKFPGIKDGKKEVKKKSAIVRLHPASEVQKKDDIGMHGQWCYVSKQKSKKKKNKDGEIAHV